MSSSVVVVEYSRVEDDDGREDTVTGSAADVDVEVEIKAGRVERPAFVKARADANRQSRNEQNGQDNFMVQCDTKAVL